MSKFTPKSRSNGSTGPFSRRFSLRQALRTAALLLLVACAAEPTPAPMPAATAAPPSPTMSPSPAGAFESTVTRPPDPAPTSTLPAAAPTGTPCSHAYFFSPAPPSCPAGASRTSAAAEQPFEGGVMIWLEEAEAILVLYADLTWQRFPDTWAKGQPESDPALIPPAGRFQPIRGFGKLWRERPEVRERLGWALGVELAFEAVLQEQAGLPPVTFMRVFNGQVIALTARQPDAGDWGVAAA